METARQAKPKPPDEICPQCKKKILLTRCTRCNGTGRQEMGTVSMLCTWCGGEGWVKGIHICMPKLAIPEQSKTSQWDQPLGYAGFDQDPLDGIRGKSDATPSPSTSSVGDHGLGLGWIVVVLLLLLVGVVFIPELRNLVEAVLTALWALFMDLLGFLTTLVRSFVG